MMFVAMKNERGEEKEEMNEGERNEFTNDIYDFEIVIYIYIYIYIYMHTHHHHLDSFFFLV
jgi:hypothetical protein